MMSFDEHKERETPKDILKSVAALTADIIWDAIIAKFRMMYPNINLKMCCGLP